MDAMHDLALLSADELRAGYQAHEFSPVEVVDALAARIEQLNPALGAFTTMCLERASEEARSAEQAYLGGKANSPLLGVPFGAKDMFDSKGIRTTYGSAMFSDHIPSADAAAVRRVREAGGILVGKTQTHEFAWGITSVNPVMGTSRNPWSVERVSGGSSGGSAVALAANLVPLALGSDTGGSIRVPSAFCGTVGLKPTYGRISKAGMFPLADSLDHPGPMARTPTDAAMLLAALAGVDPDDPTTEDVPVPEMDVLETALEDVRVGVCPDLHVVPLAPDIQEAFDSTTRVLERLGAEFVEVALPEAERVYEVFGVIQRAEALFTHAQAGLFPARREEYGEDILRRLELATRALTSDYLEASAARQRLRTGLTRVFSEADLLLTPVAAGSPLLIGEEQLAHLGRERDFRELVLSYTVLQDLTGLPAVAVRAGFDALGIPIGVQLTGPPWSEARVLGAANAFHAATEELQQRRPGEQAPAAPSYIEGVE
jgi:aspartyl-tRNA(Asn)/glutamyl-tRNA(Gln) amidotransferase subunit A